MGCWYYVFSSIKFLHIYFKIHIPDRLTDFLYSVRHKGFYYLMGISLFLCQTFPPNTFACWNNRILNAENMSFAFPSDRLPVLFQMFATPSVCSHCGKVFSSKGALVKHQREIHQRERFACHVCGQKFTQMIGLRRHTKRRHGRRVFQCATCGKDYGLLEDFNMHLRSLNHVAKPVTDQDIMEGSSHADTQSFLNRMQQQQM